VQRLAPTEEKYIIQTEQKLGVTFPASFRKNMMRENGGEVETEPDAWQLFPFLDTSDKTRLKRTCNDIIRETASAKEWDGFPKEAVAIGSNVGGDKLILLPSDDPTQLQNGVFWWDHETRTVHKITDDFEKLK
jgi:cell wall assembly regulator SMI1